MGWLVKCGVRKAEKACSFPCNMGCCGQPIWKRSKSYLSCAAWKAEPCHDHLLSVVLSGFNSVSRQQSELELVGIYRLLPYRPVWRLNIEVQTLNWTTRQTMASFTFTAESVVCSSPEGALGAVEMPWLLFVPLCDGGAQMGRRKVPRTHKMLPNSSTWHTDVSNCF